MKDMQLKRVTDFFKKKRKGSIEERTLLLLFLIWGLLLNSLSLSFHI